MLSPLEYYVNALQSGEHVYDPAQERIMHFAQAMYISWKERDQQKPSLWQRLFGKKQYIKGLYIWGGVGRGKTYIMDVLYTTLPTSRKLRVHFHQFMRNVHQMMQEFNNSANPLRLVAGKVTQDIDILFIDEFHVNDIADAMILAGLLEQLFANGLSLVTTSNIEVNDLYRDGLQRERFLPAIALLQLNLHIVEIADGIDYRANTVPAPFARQEEYMRQLLQQKGVTLQEYDQPIIINNRAVHARAVHDDIVWFDFHELCDTPRSVADYIEIAQNYREIMLTDIPPLGEHNENAALRFVRLVDALYDARVCLVFWLDMPVSKLYTGRISAFQFQRTISRLVEMQSEQYRASCRPKPAESQTLTALEKDTVKSRNG